MVGAIRPGVLSSIPQEGGFNGHTKGHTSELSPRPEVASLIASYRTGTGTAGPSGRVDLDAVPACAQQRRPGSDEPWRFHHRRGGAERRNQVLPQSNDLSVAR